MRLFFLSLIFLSVVANAQQPDVIIRAGRLLKELSASKEVKADSAARLLQPVYQELKRNSSDSSQYYRCRVLTELSFYEHSLSQYDKSIASAQEALGLAEQLNHPILIYNAAYRLGSTYAKLGSNISTLNSEADMEQYRHKSRFFFARTKEAAIQLKDSSKIISSQVGVINTFLSGKQNDSVLLLSTGLLKSIQPGMHKEKSQLYNLAGIASYESGEFARAGIYFKRAVEEARQVPGSLTLSSSLGNLANVYMEQGNYTAARSLLYELIASNQVKKRKQALSKNYITLHNIYKRAGIYDSALYYLEKYYVYRDSILSEEHKLQIEELELKYETGKKESRINELTLSNALKTAQLSQKNLWLSLLLVLGIVIPIVIFLYYRQRAMRQRQEHAEIKQQLLTAQMNPHFLFNALNSIQRLYVDGHIEEGNLFMSEFAQFVRDILDKTARAKIPVEEEVEFLNAYLSLEKKRLGDKFDFRIYADEVVLHGGYEVPSLIVQPLVENALLHGIMSKEGKGFIDITISAENESAVIFSVKDNGIGIDAAVKKRKLTVHHSKGTELIRARLGNKGKLHINTLKDAEGTITGTAATLVITF